MLQKPLSVFMGILMCVATVFLIALTVQTINKIKNPSQYQNMITVEGIGKTKVVPNLAVLNLGVRTEQPSVKEAQTENTNTTNKVMAALKELAIEEKDIQTQNYSVYENKMWNQETRKEESLGWVVTQTIEVKVRDDKNVSSVVNLAGTYGLTDISGPNFQLDETSVYTVEAREKAIANAKEQAQKIADQLGVKLGKVTGYSEWHNNPPEQYAGSTMMSDVKSEAVMAPTLSRGETEVNMTVNITYLLK